MPLLHVIVLGIIQGLTEFLPISSSAHLALIPKLLGWADQGLAFDIARYREIVRACGGPVLELCCGTGRIAIPIARDGYHVVGVDVSTGMLGQFRENLQDEHENITIHKCVEHVSVW